MQIKAIQYAGHNALELTTDTSRMVAITDFGPRIAFLGEPDGENLLYWEPHTLHRGDWFLHGGHRLWVTRPGADECEETYLPDNQPVTAKELADGIRLTAPIDPVNRTQRQITVTAQDNQHFRLDHRLTNTSDMLFSCGLWTLTCTKPAADTVYGVPLGDGSSWDAATIVAFRRWGGHGCESYADDQFQCTDDMFVLRPVGRENKRMIQSHSGIIAMSAPTRNLTFAKQATYAPDADYPLNCNVAMYVGPDNFMVEMENMSPIRNIKPGQSIDHSEIWAIRKGAVDLTQRNIASRLF